MSDELFQAIRRGDSAEVAARLDGGPDVAGARNGDGVSAVSFAMYCGRPEIARMLVSRGATLDLFEAAAVGDLPRVREIVSADPAAVESYSADGFPPLGLAAFFGHQEVVSFLLDQGAGVHASARNPLKVQPIHAAVSRRSAVIVRMLLERGADPNARQQAGYTPLHVAAGSGDREIVEMLVAAGADRSARSDDGKAPADLAREKGHQAVAELLGG